MIVLFNKKITRNKCGFISLTVFFGVGYSYSRYLVGKIGFSKLATFQKIKREHIRILTRLLLRESLLEVGLIRQIREDLRFQRATFTYKGRRHLVRLPVNGQRTKTNRKTAKHNKSLDILLK